MPQFKQRLRVSQHEGRDYAAKPVETKDAQGNVTKTYPKRRWTTGEVVVSNVDLVKRFGEKFEYVGDPPKEGDEEEATPNIGGTAAGQSHFPGGQVSTGFQQTSTGADGRPVSGPASEETLKKIARDREEAQQYSPYEEPNAPAHSAWTDDELRQMTVPELEKVAQEEQIPLGNAKKKDDILRAIRQAR